jgi:hypothetical protein
VRVDEVDGRVVEGEPDGHAALVPQLAHDACAHHLHSNIGRMVYMKTISIMLTRRTSFTILYLAAFG